MVEAIPRRFHLGLHTRYDHGGAGSGPKPTQRSPLSKHGDQYRSERVTFTATVTPQTGSTPVAQLPVAFLNGSDNHRHRYRERERCGDLYHYKSSCRSGLDHRFPYTGNSTDLQLRASNAVSVNVTQTGGGYYHVAERLRHGNHDWTKP